MPWPLCACLPCPGHVTVAQLAFMLGVPSSSFRVRRRLHNKISRRRDRQQPAMASKKRKAPDDAATTDADKVSRPKTNINAHPTEQRLISATEENIPGTSALEHIHSRHSPHENGWASPCCARYYGDPRKRPQLPSAQEHLWRPKSLPPLERRHSQLSRHPGEALLTAAE